MHFPRPYIYQVVLCLRDRFCCSSAAKMRHKNFSLRFDVKRAVCVATFLFSIVALLFSISAISRLYSTVSFLGLPTSHNQTNPNKEATKTEYDHSHRTIARIVQNIEAEIKDMREIMPTNVTEDDVKFKNERVRYTAFLADILSLVGSLEASSHKRESDTDDNIAPRSVSDQLPDELLSEFFLVEEIRKYIRIKPNRLGKQNFMGANATFNSIGHACFTMKDELEQYMDYDVGDICQDDWKLAQKLMVHGCDPLPRRRCFSTSPKLYTKPLPADESMWALPDDRNVRWNHYRCKNFTCLARNGSGKGFFKCADCFNLTHHESPRWMEVVYLDPLSNLTSDFLIQDVLKIKPAGEIRVGLDFSAGTGTFAARMKDFNVTVVTATINFGAPFNEMISLRGLVPLYLTVNQRLPFFDNTLDIIHTTRFLDGWIDFILLDFVLYDWDRVLRPGGLLWIDSFFCLEKDLENYLDAFQMLRYKRHRWVVVPKVDKDSQEVFFSAVLEKPPRPF